MRLFLALALALLSGPALSETRVPESRAEISLSFAPLVREAAPAVVNIYARRVVETRRSPFAEDPFFGEFFREFGQRQPRVQNSPGSPRSTVSPVSGSTILISTWGWARPMEAVRLSRSSSIRVWQDTGDVSVMPYAIATSAMCMSSMHRFITSTGHTAPAMMPVRSDDRSRAAKSGWFCIAMNIVGTP